MSVVKEGYIKRHSKNLFSGGWGDVWVRLYSDSYLLAFKKKGDREPKAKIFMKDVCKHFAFGEHVRKNFPSMPELPAGASLSNVIAIPEKPSHKAKPHYFLCNNETELHEWMSAICSTLPPRPQNKPANETITATSSQPVSAGYPTQQQGYSAPPPGYSPGPPGYAPAPPPAGYAPGPGMPQPGIGFANIGPPPPQGGSPYPQQAYAPPPGPYPQQPGPYPQQAYAGYPQQQYGPPPGQYGYQQPPPQQYGYQQHGYAQPQQNVVYVKDKKKGGGILGSNTGKMAAGLIGGAALGYGASRMMGGFGHFGGFGMGRCGSWSSLSSFGSCGSFGSFGSFD